MAKATVLDSGELVTFDVKIDGSSIPDEENVFAIDVSSAVNRISYARIKVLDGDAGSGTFKASSSSNYIPGSKISIEAGYNTKNKIIFSGIIVSQNISINSTIGPSLEIICRDEAIATTVGRKSKTFSEKTDSGVIKSILNTYSGIKADISATTKPWPQLVQYYTSDWDFVLSRAEANGLVVTTKNGTLSVINPLSDTTSVLTLVYGYNLEEFNGDLNSLSQLGKVSASSWDYAKQQLISEENLNDFAGAGNISSKKLAEVIGLKEYELQSSGALKDEDLVSWGKAQMVKSELSKFIGEVTCQGTSLVHPGNFFTLAGLGERFNGDHFVSGVKHTISDGNWTTELEFGLSEKWFTETPDIMAPPAAGLLPGVNGLFTATVKKTYADPENQYRILIDIPLFDTEGEGIWARHGSFYASSNAGAFFLPEVGDEVIVGFLNEDPRYPIILGSLYSNEKKKPFDGLEPNEQNSVKAIVSKSGMRVTFDDENKVFTITTPNKNEFILSDTEQEITIKDQNSNSIVMSGSGIQIKSPKDISIEASKHLMLKGSQGVNIESIGGDIKIAGLNINQTAQVQYAAEGGATASVQGGGELSLKGAMVMIN